MPASAKSKGKKPASVKSKGKKSDAKAAKKNKLAAKASKKKTDNLKNLKAAYKVWAKSGVEAKIGPLKKLMADNFSVASMDENTPGLKFAVDSSTKKASIAYLTGIFKYWTMEYFRPEQYVVQGNKIAMFGWCGYKNKENQHSVECRIANLWEFSDDGKLVSLIDVFDSAKAAAVAMAPKKDEAVAS